MSIVRKKRRKISFRQLIKIFCFLWRIRKTERTKSRKASKSDSVKPLDDGIIIISCLLRHIKVNKIRYELHGENDNYAIKINS